LLWSETVYDDECERVGGMRIGKETAVLEGNVPQCHFVHHKSYMIRPELEFGTARWEASVKPPEPRHDSLGGCRKKLRKATNNLRIANVPT
jgi:hypothetical protein